MKTGVMAVSGDSTAAGDDVLVINGGPTMNTSSMELTIGDTLVESDVLVPNGDATVNNGSHMVDSNGGAVGCSWRMVNSGFDSSLEGITTIPNFEEDSKTSSVILDIQKFSKSQFEEKKELGCICQSGMVKKKILIFQILKHGIRGKFDEDLSTNLKS